jgi:OOP family OmpA-OmpF porin
MKPISVNTLSKLTTVSLLLLACFAAHAEKGEWHIAPSVAYTDDDGDRRIDDSVAGLQVQVGKSVSEHFSLEGLLGYHDIDGFPGQKHLEIGFNAVGNLWPDRRFSPYVIGGVGYLRADVGEPDFGGLPTAGSTASNPTGTAGLGLQAQLGDSPWSLRAEWRLRRTFDSDASLTDQVASIGLQYAFGNDDSEPVMPLAEESEPVIPLVDDAPLAPADADGDGVPDDQDRCPGTAPSVAVDNVGCEEIHFENIHFDTESAVLDAAAKRKLDEVAEILMRNADVEVVIAGHADSRGPEDYNMRLSVKRAESVRRHLAEQGVAVSRMTVRGFGESQPVASNETASGQAKNRRVELRAMGR